MAVLDDVQIKVVPVAVGAPAAMSSAMRVLDFEDPGDSDVATWSPTSA
jgi:hypothetical protein